MLKTNAEKDQANHSKQESKVAEPKPVFRSGATAKLLGAPVHPKITGPTAKLLANDQTDEDTEELQAELLRVEFELWKEELRDFHGEENAAEAEDDRIGDSRDPNGSVAEERQGLNELVETERLGVDAPEVQILLLECGNVVAHFIAHVEGFGAEEEVGDELNAVGLQIVSLPVRPNIFK